jgi:hypothetical protein
MDLRDERPGIRMADLQVAAGFSVSLLNDTVPM